MSIEWSKKYWDGLNKLNGLRAVLDPNDEAGEKNERINEIHQLAIKKTFKKIGIQHVGRLLDYGCGIGRNYDFLSSKCQHYIGVDISLGMLQKTKGEPCLIGGINLPFKNNMFDLICSFWVLQHVVEDKVLDDILSAFNRCVKSDGIIIICERSSRESRFEPGKEKEYINRRSPSSYIKRFSKHGMVCFYAMPIKPYSSSKKAYVKWLLKKIGSFHNNNCYRTAWQNGDNIYVFKKNTK